MTIEITISPQGKAKVEVKGASGGACLKASAAIEKALGTVTKRTLKSEYHDPVKVAETVQIKS